MDTARQQLDHLIEQEELTPADYQRAATALDLYPALPQWRRFLDQLLLWLSALALGFSVLFFIAYNWTAMDRLGRFLLVELALVIALGVYLWRGGRDSVAQALLFTAALLVGGLLALFGQTYQTGADPWQLFFTWSLMILPWALIARLSALWLLVIGLWSVAALLYHQTFNALWFLRGETGAAWALLLINGGALAVWEMASRHFNWLNTGWPQRILAIGVGAAATWLALIDITAFRNDGPGWHLLVYGLVLGALYGVYRHIKPDLFVLAGGCLSFIVVADWLIVYHVSFQNDSAFLLLSVMTIGLTTASVRWLIHLNRALHHDTDH